MSLGAVAVGKAVNMREIYRYMGYQGNVPDADVRALTDEVLGELLQAIEPKSIYKRFECAAEDGIVRLYDMESKSLSITASSRNLADNLAGCRQAVVMAATLGIGADKLLGRYELVNMAKASIAQACGAECIEAYCNLIQEEIKSNWADKEGLYLRPRFSAGYGDLALETQKDIFSALECTKRIGLTLTQSLLMYPTKSVTAFIGLTADAGGCYSKSGGKCAACGNKGCEFRND